MSDKSDKLREHSYDGIRRLDNDLPRWWLWLFAITVIISVIYPFYYDFGPGEFASETVDAEVLAIRDLQQESAPKVADSSALLKLAADPNFQAKGKTVYITRCLPCHGDRGQGIVGPNLTDDHWIHGGTITEIQNVILNGVLEKGMLAWKDQLPADDIQAVTAYVWALHGTNPAGAKAPQGEIVKRTE